MPKSKEHTQDLYLLITETREGEYFHLRGRFVVQKYENSQWTPYGVDDDYSDGLLWSGLRISCQGDQRSQLRPAEAGEQGPVYGFDTEYRDVYSVDLRRARRHLKTLEKLQKGLAKLHEARGYVRSYGEYVGRVAEVMDCKGMAFERDQRSRAVTGTRWDWMSTGDGVNRANHRIYLWQQEATDRLEQPKPATEEQAQ